MKTVILILTGLLATSVSAHPFQSLYGDQINFDVYRKGDLVGYYQTSFTDTDAGWRVNVDMVLSFKVFAIIGIEFRYQATEHWLDDQLQQLEVVITQNDDITQYNYERQGDKMVLVSGNLDTAITEFDAELLATHHYNPDVLQKNKVFNTLTGKINQFELSLKERNGDLTVWEYNGQLNRTQAKYTANGAWSGLSFPDKTGTTLQLICNQCQ